MSRPTSPTTFARLARIPLRALIAMTLGALALRAQAPVGALRTQVDSAARLRLTVLHDSLPVEAALVRSGTTTSQTDRAGTAILRLPAGTHLVLVARLGFVPESLTITLVASADTSVTVRFSARVADLDAVTIAATRSGRRIEDEPVRVEVLAREEVEEKMLMTPGDIAMMLNETSGLRVQTTSPSLGGANVRIQGLRGRYTQVLSDGLPLYGGQAGALGLLQIPPMDLQRVEVIKGAASALYGAQALGGVINLVSRRPDPDGERELLFNQTTRGGTDGVLWLSGAIAPTWGYTLLGGAHRQHRGDLDDDGWTDLPGYERVVVRPRLFWESGTGSSVFLTLGTTVESREGGTLPGRLAPDGLPFIESLDTRRLDFGSTAKVLFGGRRLLHLRSSITDQRHEHRFGTVPENDRHRTWFAEASLSAPTTLGTWIIGTALQEERYRSDEVPRFDYTHATASAFVQLDADPLPWLALSVSARVDTQSEYGTVVNPRFSALARASESGPLAGWTMRASLATGAFAPTPFTEESEVTGLTPLQPIGDLRPERAATASLDFNGHAFGMELNATVFGSVVRDPTDLIADTGTPGMLRLVNVGEPTRTAGTEFLARWQRDAIVVTGTYTFIDAMAFDPEVVRRVRVPLVPRHAIGVVGMYEAEGRGRAGLELYYTGTQALSDNPYRSASPPYLIVGFLVERRVGAVRLFLNAENLGDVRQTRVDPLVRPTRGAGGRWTTDAWTELAGRTFNGGVRWAF